jgi:tripartite-type tricarboxylate transporter receptor subunit TctC
MKMNNKLALITALIIGALGQCPSASAAETAKDYPSHTVRIVVSYSAGGSNDIVARAVASELSQQLGQTFIVENRPGASGTIGADYVAKSPPDGYTLFMGAGAHTLAPALFKQLPYDIVHDFAPVSIAATSSYVLVVNPSVPVHSVPELIALAKAEPGKLNYASAGKGTPLHLAAELFKSMTNSDIVHVPYGGDTPALIDLISGNVQLAFMSVSSTAPQIEAGNLRALAVTSTQRTAALPDLPTLQELGFSGYDIGTWWGLFAPAGTPPDIVQKLNDAMHKVVQTPSVKERFAPHGLDATSDSPQEFAAFVKNETERYARIAKIAGIQPE